MATRPEHGSRHNGSSHPRFRFLLRSFDDQPTNLAAGTRPHELLITVAARSG
jgi:hypothetical protein